MAKEKKEPKRKSDGLFSKDAEVVLIGLMLSLIALIGLLNRGPMGEFLTFLFVYLFGTFYFVVYLILLYTGIYLVLKRKCYKVQIHTVLLGAILFMIGIMIISSLAVDTSTEGLQLKNVFSMFSKQMNDIATGVLIQDLEKVQFAGGGLIGFFLAALFNTLVTSVGTTIIALVLAGAGFVLLTYRVVAKFLAFVKKKRQAKKEKNAKKQEEMQQEEEEEQEEVVSQPQMSYADLGGGNQAAKAHFVLSSSKIEKKEPAMPILAEDIDEDIPLEEAPKEEEKVEVEIEEETIPLKHREVVAPTASKVTYVKAPTPEPPVIKPKTTVKKEVPVQQEEKPYVYPGVDLLNDYENAHVDEENERISIERQTMINGIFEDLGIGASVSGYKVGPSVTRFDVLTNRDVSVNMVSKYVDDISIRLGGVNARFEKVVKGKMTSGLEIPNAHAVTVSFKECIQPLLHDPKKKYLAPFGKDITGDVIGVNVTDYPHLLVAGSTGSGKSVFIHCLIMSLIMKTKPSELKIMLIDPKRVEMAKYKEMPHLICPIISEYDKSKVAMNKLVMEMERRYQLFEDAGVSKISQYNEYAEEEGKEKLPIIVVVIDEYADLVENCKDIASPVVKIAQKSRAAGIHMVISTQRPSVNVITGVIKGNLPSRVALRVASTVDSQTILGEGGAEKLLGYGDMLVDCPEISGQGFTRLQCPFVDNKEIRRVVEFLKEHYEVQYLPDFLDLTDHSAAGPSFPGMGGSQTKDERYEEVKAYVMDLKEVSISELQRVFGFGFPRAGRIITALAMEGVIAKSSESGSNKRKVLLHNQSALEKELNEEHE